MLPKVEATFTAILLKATRNTHTSKTKEENYRRKVASDNKQRRSPCC
jgi:hypothetical protein